MSASASPRPATAHPPPPNRRSVARGRRGAIALAAALLGATPAPPSAEAQSVIGVGMDQLLPPEPEFSPQAIAQVLEDARALVGNAQYAEAIVAYRLYLEKRPTDLQAELELARILSWTRAYGESVKLYHHILTQVPGDVELELERAKVMLWDGQYKEAAEALAKLRARLEVPVVLGPSPDAGDEVEVSPALATRGSDALLERLDRALADAYAWSGQLEAAIPLYERLWSLYPLDTTLGLALARALAQQRQFQAAIPVYAELAEAGIADPPFVLERGRLLLWAERYQEGLLLLENLRQKLALERASGRHTSLDLIDELSRAIATGYAWSGDHTRAAVELRALVLAQPEDGEMRILLARSCRELALVDESIEHYDAYLALRPRDFAVELERGRALLWAERYPAAHASFQTLLERLEATPAPSDLPDADRLKLSDETRRMLARSYLWQGRPLESLPYLLSLTRRTEEDRELTREIALGLARAGEYEHARALYARYEAMGGSALAARVGQAQTWQQEGDLLRARNTFEAALRIDGTHQEARAALAALDLELRWPNTPSMRLRLDSDGLTQLGLAFYHERPLEQLWFGAGLELDRFAQVEATITRLSPYATARYRHNRQFQIQGLLGVQLSFTPDSPVTLKLDATGRWRPLPALRIDLNLLSADAADLVFTRRAIEERLRQLALKSTAYLAFQPHWQAVAEARVIRLTRPLPLCDGDELCSNFALQGLVALEHHLPLTALPGSTLGLSLGAAALHYNQVDPSLTYWSPSLYANVGPRASLMTELEPGIKLEGRVGLGLGWASDVKGAFPEVSVELHGQQRLSERLGWQLEAAYGRTVRQLIAPSDASAQPPNGYWSGRLGISGWYLF